MDIVGLRQFARNSVRFRDVVTILAKYGLADWLGDHRFDWLQERLRSADGRRLDELGTNQRIRYALTELGATFIKLGQVLSTRPDLVGTDLAEELSQLQANTPADPPEYVAHLIESEFDEPPSELFARFNPEPFASASIGQVHAATLSDGTKVVVKVQHQAIEDRVQNDLEILHMLSSLAEEVSPATRQYQPKKTAEEFSKTLLKEMDFSREASNLRKFQQNFADDDQICIPAVHEAHSSRRVLTMDFLKGTSLGDEAKLAASGHDLTDLARRGAEMFLDMIFRDGFCHADPHPGNLLVLDDGSIGLLDCGMVARINEELREQVEDMAIAAVDR
ncbi:MAG: AarF/UbiB family protein, partial [Planctomycetota bacterium]